MGAGFCVALLGSCAPASPALRDPTPSIASASAAPRTPAPPRARVAASLSQADGSQYGTWVALDPDPAELVKPCYQQALGLDPELAGWEFLKLEPKSDALEVTLLRGSELPELFRTCIVERVRTARVKSRFDPSGQPLVLYLRFER